MSNGVDLSIMGSTALLALALADVKVILSGVGPAEFSIKKVLREMFARSKVK